jgi:hypothetical protein
VNFIETIYCSQYYELKKSGRDPMKGRLNGTLLNATVLILSIVSIIALFHKYVPGHYFAHLSWQVSNSSISGKFAGKVLGFLALLLIGGILHFTVGSETNYVKMMERWEKLPEDVLGQTVKSALKIFGIVFVFFLLTIFGTLL